MGCKLRIERLTAREHRTRAGDIGNIGSRLARENRIIRNAAFLRAFDFRIPIRALHQTHGDTALVRAAEFGEPRERGKRALLIGLHRQAKAIPTLQLRRGAQGFEHIEHQVETFGLFGIDGETEIGGFGFGRERNKRRKQFAHHTFVLRIFVARMQRGKFDRDAGAGKDIGDAAIRFFRNGSQRTAIGREIAGGIRLCVCGFAQHVEGIAVFLFGVAERFLDGAAQNELAAKNSHGIGDRLTDYRLARAAQKFAPDALEIPLRVFEADDAAREHQREGGGVDEQRLRFAQMLIPFAVAELIADQAIGGFGIRHAQQRFRQAHQHHAFLRGQRIFLKQRIYAAMGGPRADTVHQFAGERLGGGMLTGRQCGLGKQFRGEGVFFGEICSGNVAAQVFKHCGGCAIDDAQS